MSVLRPVNALIDANLLTLWIIGNVAEEEVPRCRRTRHYSVNDFRLLHGYVGRCARVVVTPNVATEASNLIAVLQGKYLLQARSILAQALEVWEEVYVKSADASALVEYRWLGLSDAAILLAASTEVEVLTDDLRLFDTLCRRGVKAINFNRLRVIGMLD